MKKIKFTQELKDKWLTALRSGEYSQTSYSLRDENGFCCLGVLCDIIDPEGWCGNLEDVEDDSKKHRLGHIVYGEHFFDKFMTIPDDLYSLLPISYVEFANRNDGDDEYEPHNFSEMADYIEDNVQADG